MFIEPRQSDPGRRAFTLLELIVSLAISAIVVLAMGSALMVTVRSLPAAAAAAPGPRATARVIDQIAAEVAYATAVTVATATEIEFTVQRHGAPVTIRYVWAGTAGAPLQRAYDAGGLVTIVPAVEEFDLGYGLDSTGLPEDNPGIEGPEQLFLFQDSSNSGSGTNFVIVEGDRMAETFLPALPADAMSWRIARIKINATGQNPENGVLNISIQPATDTGEPSGVIVDDVSWLESDLPNNWVEISFADAGGLSPATPHCIVFTHESAPGTVARIKTGTGSLGSPDTRYFADEQVGTWTEDATRDVWLWIVGHVTTPDPDWVAPSTALLRSVDITLDTEGTVTSRARASATTYNVPEFPAGP